MRTASIEGLPYPLGLPWSATEHAYNFALYSKHATEVWLLLFGDDPRRPLLRRQLDARPHKSGRVWHCRVVAAAGTAFALVVGDVVTEALVPFTAGGFLYLAKA